MNLDRLRQAEGDFLSLYPGGFAHPELQALGKKHKMEQMVAATQQAFTPEAFEDARQITEDMIRLVSRASVVSVFEKPKFRDYVRALAPKSKQALAEALRQQLHGDQQTGFEAMLEILSAGKLAKWSLMTVLPNYYRPDEEVFIKPTTAKGVIKTFELENLEYKPRPSWAFYTAYRRQILQMREAVDESIAPSIAAFCGFLMMSLDD